MNFLRSLFTGLITAAASIVIVVGGISLALTEGFSLAVPPTLAVQTEPVVITLPGETGRPPVLATVTAQARLVTATPMLATTCPVPAGWAVYTVQSGDSLHGLAAAYDTTVQAIQAANCLITTSLMPGTILALPPALPTATLTLYPSLTSVPCGPPWGWVRYLIQPGDTLMQISLATNTSVSQLMSANCLTSPLIRAGAVLWVPYLPARIPTATLIPPTPVPSATFTPVTPIATTETPGPIITGTPSSTVTVTDTQAPTATNTNTPVPEPTAGTGTTATIAVGLNTMEPTATPIPPTPTTNTTAISTP